jgi:hypothetical protein
MLPSCSCWKMYIIKSVCLVVLLLEDVIKHKFSLIWMIYLAVSSPNQDKVESLILRLMVSVNAMLFLWMLLQMVHRSKGPSFRYSCTTLLITATQKSSVMEPSSKQVRTQALKAGWSMLCLSMVRVGEVQQSLASCSITDSSIFVKSLIKSYLLLWMAMKVMGYHPSSWRRISNQLRNGTSCSDEPSYTGFMGLEIRSSYLAVLYYSGVFIELARVVSC